MASKGAAPSAVPFLTFICLRATLLRMTLRTECKIVTSEIIPLFFRNVDLGTRYVTVCVVSLVAGRSGGMLSAVFLQPIQNRGLYRTEE
jgi:hypothetical protein